MFATGGVVWARSLRGGEGKCAELCSQLLQLRKAAAAAAGREYDNEREGGAAGLTIITSHKIFDQT